MHRKFGKKDVIFIGVLLGICLIVLGVWYFAGGFHDVANQVIWILFH